MSRLKIYVFGMSPMGCTFIVGPIAFLHFLVITLSNASYYTNNITWAGLFWVITLMMIVVEFWQARKNADHDFGHWHLKYTSKFFKGLYVLLNALSFLIFVNWCVA